MDVGSLQQPCVCSLYVRPDSRAPGLGSLGRYIRRPVGTAQREKATPPHADKTHLDTYRHAHPLTRKHYQFPVQQLPRLAGP
eukprot:scaffold21421_cov23-Tisochrysis_lutea.AAC.1